MTERGRDPNVRTAEPIRIGVVGGGQLGRMLAEAAAPLGVEIVALDPTPDPPIAPVAREVITADFDDTDAILSLAERVDCLTVEIELADPDALRAAGDTTGVPVHPAPETVELTRDKLAEKRALDAADIPVPAFRGVDGPGDLETAFDELGPPLMVKARRGGYDGRGNAPVGDVDDAREYFGDLEGLVAEELVDFDRELSAMGIRGAGTTACYPVVENVHREEILRETVAPARTDPEIQDRARSVVLAVLEVLDGRGVFGVECFETPDGSVLVNEIAPRPHNSGHYTIEAALTSQFEQHVRALLGAPIGGTTLRDPAAMANVLGDVDRSGPVDLRGVDRIAAAPRTAFHWYGKREARPLRKLGHITTLAGPDEGVDDALDRVRGLRDGLSFVESR